MQQSQSALSLLSMAYKIQYFRDGKSYTEVYWDETLPETRETARKGLKRNRAQYANILDLERGARQVETVTVQATP